MRVTLIFLRIRLYPVNNHKGYFGAVIIDISLLNKLRFVSMCSLPLILFYVKYTAQNMKFSIKDFFSKYKQIRSLLRIWSHLLKKSLIENFIFCAVIFEIGVFESWVCIVPETCHLKKKLNKLFQLLLAFIQSFY